MTHSVVIGANRGIGLELAKQLRSRGDTVTATCRTPSDELTSLDVSVVPGVDVRDEKTLRRLTDALEGKTVDTLICNAGILRQSKLGELKYDGMVEQFNVNALGPLRVVEALSGTLKQGSKIGIVTSRMGSMADNGSGGSYGYRMSKAAVNAAGVSLAQDLKSKGVAVVLLHPGYVRTDMTGNSGHVDPDESARGLIARVGELTLDTTGRFVHMNGEALPW